MCSNFRAIVHRYSPEQIEQGLWAVFSGDIDCQRYLFQPWVDRAARVACIESMYWVFHGAVAQQRCGSQGTFWMWWDLILHTNGLSKRPTDYRLGHVQLTEDEECIIDAIYRTCSRILEIPHRGCQWSAIHGMGHLYHPEMPARLQQFLDEHREELSEQDIVWVQAAAENRIA
jgi:hypothetical protein